MVESAVSFGFDLRDSVFLSAEIMIGIFAICGNSLVLATIYMTPGLHTTTNLFLCNLAAADICVGMFVAPCAILAHYGMPANYYGCVFINCLMLVFCDVSILLLLVIAVERFFAIQQPFTYQRMVTMKRALKINVLIWLIGLATGLLPLFAWRHPYNEIHFCTFDEVILREYMVYAQFCGIVLTSLVFMFISYIYIFFVVRRHVQQIETIREILGLAPDPNFQRSYRQELKTARTLAIMLVVFCHCWIPIGVIHSIQHFCSGCSIPYPLYLAATALSHANSCINPILYSTSNTNIRAAMWKLLCSDSVFESGTSMEMASRRATLHPTSLRQKSSQSLGFIPKYMVMESNYIYCENRRDSDDTATIY